MKNVTIFAPEAIEFDMTALGLKKYKMPGDVPAEIIFKLMAMGERAGKGEAEAVKEIKDLICDLFSVYHSEEELAELKDKLGFRATMQIVTAVYDQLEEVAGEAKNPKALGEGSKE
jgi:hypothetical protein